MEAPSLSAADVAAFDRDGCVLLRGFLSAEEVRDLVRWVNDLQVWCPPTPAEQLSGDMEWLCRHRADAMCTNCAPLRKGEEVQLPMLCLHGPSGRCTNWCGKGVQREGCALGSR